MYRHFPIGDVWNGYDISKITDIFNQFIAFMNTDECKNCWTVRMCPYCFTEQSEEHTWPEIKNGACVSFRRRLENAITNYCAILEENPKAFDYMNDYAIA